MKTLISLLVCLPLLTACSSEQLQTTALILQTASTTIQEIDRTKAAREELGRVPTVLETIQNDLVEVE